MRELELLGDYLVRLRQEKLQEAHALALSSDAELLDIKRSAFEAELCDRIRIAVALLDHDVGRFVKEYMQ